MLLAISSSTAWAQRSSGDSGDIVETIGPAPATPSAPAPPPRPPAAPSPHSFNLRGWARASAIVGLQRTGPTTPPELRYVPHDRLVVAQQMFLRLRYAYARSFEVVASGLLSFGAYEEDAPRAQDFNLVNGAGTRTAFEGSLREAYVGAFWRSLDFRIGQQRIAWGRGDAFTPNDILDGYDLRDQLLAESDALHLPNFAARLGLDLGFGSLEAVVQPFFQPNRFDVYGGNWSLVQTDSPLPYITLLGLANRAVSPTLHDALQPLLGQTELPPNDFTATAAALRYGINLHRFDLNVYYQYGWDRTPKLEIDPQYATLLHNIDYAHPIDPTPFIQPFLSGAHPVRATYVRRHHVGIDAATTVGPLLLRAEAAFDSSHVLIARDDMHGVVAPVVQATAGVEYQPGEFGKIVLVEGWYLHVLDPGDTQPLWFVQRDSAGAAALVRWHFFREQLQLEARSVVGVQPFSWMVRGEAGYKHKALQIRAGAVILDGDPFSFGHFYRANTSVYLLVKYSI
ncbi:MAG: DUF1302 family protein [Polyangia bacterium]